MKMNKKVFDFDFVVLFYSFCRISLDKLCTSLCPFQACSMDPVCDWDFRPEEFLDDVDFVWQQLRGVYETTGTPPGISDQQQLPKIKWRNCLK